MFKNARENVPKLTRLPAKPRQLKPSGGEGRLLRVAEYVRMSTDHQRYSIENQSVVIRSYAAKHKMKIVRTYSDSGKSGLDLVGRKGLRSLLADVALQEFKCTAILVYDISRWGRFQDADESAYYEYLCRRSGVRVIYCAEMFDDDGSPMATVIKSIRRAMAAEYSRELSVKSFMGKCRLAEMGYRQGGGPGFGLRRLLIDGAGNIKTILGRGERKSLQTDRVILVPGPREEVETVWHIYDLYICEEKGEQEIAEILNAAAIDSPSAFTWSRNTIHEVLSNDKYVGNNVFNRSSCKLRAGTRMPNPEGMWISCSRAFLPLVSKDLFARVQAEICNRTAPYSTSLLKRKLRSLLDNKGNLSGVIIDREPGMPAASTYAKHFGGMRQAYAAIGYCKLRNLGYIDNRANLQQMRLALISLITEGFMGAGALVSWDDTRNLLVVNETFTASINIVPCRLVKRRGEKKWKIQLRKSAAGDIIFLARLEAGNLAIRDFSVIARAVLPEVSHSWSAGALSMRSCRFQNLNGIYEKTLQLAASASRRD